MKRKIIKILIPVIFLLITYMAWLRNFKNMQENNIVIIKIDYLKYTGVPQTEGDFAFYIQGTKCKAFDRHCPHLGCKLRADKEHNCFLCPCHGSRFSRDGKVLQGPAVENLKEYKCEVEGDHIRIYK